MVVWSQSDARKPIRAPFSETTEAVYRPMRSASGGVEQTKRARVDWMLIVAFNPIVNSMCDDIQPNHMVEIQVSRNWNSDS